MNQIVRKKVFTLLLAVCIIISNLTMAFAGTKSTQTAPPTLTAIEKEVTATAQYLKSSVDVTTLTTASKFYNASRTLTLLLRSGVDCTSLVDAYLAEITTNYVSNGDLTLGEPITAYAYLSIVLALSGRDATAFNGINLIEKFESAITNANQTTLNSLNPYKLAHLYTAAYSYAKEFKNSTTCLEKLKNAILSYGNENGIYYWGNSADNNGIGLSGLSILSNTDDAIKTLVNHALLFSQTLLKEDGTSAGDFEWTTSPNANSTAASLILYATYSENNLAAKSYAGLLTFKDPDSTGSYKYATSDPVSSFGATVDALYGLISYRALLAAQTAPFDVSDTSVGLYYKVIDKINVLPSTITLNDAASLESITTTYNSLSNVFKAKVTNYLVYQTALTSYNSLVAAEVAKNAVITTTTDTTTNTDTTTPSSDQPAAINSSPQTADSNNSTLFIFQIMIAASFVVLTTSTRVLYKKRNEI